MSSIAGVLNDFVYDDVPQVEQNYRVHDLSHAADIFTSPYWSPPFAPELYRPVASMTVALQYVLGGGQPWIFRLVSYGLYALSAVLLFQLASKLLTRRVAFGVAALFAAHPVHVEAVAQAVNQGEIIVACCAVLSVLLYLRRRQGGRLAEADWGVLCTLFVVAALSKETGFVLPALLFAAELLLVADGKLRQNAASLWRGYAALAVAGIVLIVLRTTVLAGRIGGAVPAKALADSGMGGRALTMLHVVPMWLRLLAWPLHLQIDYSPNEIVASTSFGLHEAFGLLLVAAALAAIRLSWKRAPVIVFGLAWCAIALLPVSNVILPTGIVLAERTLFLPSIGFLIAVGGLVAFAAERYAWRTQLLRVLLTAACAIVVVGGVMRSAERQRVWRNGQTLWEAAAGDAPKSLRVKQAHDEAVADLTNDFLQRAVGSATPWRDQYQLATILRAMRADSAALLQLRRSIEQRPDQNDARLQLIAALISVGDYGGVAAAAAPMHAHSDTMGAVAYLIHVADSLRSIGAPAGSVRPLTR